jgi:hypothetical protein
LKDYLYAKEALIRIAALELKSRYSDKGLTTFLRSLSKLSLGGYAGAFELLQRLGI